MGTPTESQLSATLGFKIIDEVTKMPESPTAYSLVSQVGHLIIDAGQHVLAAQHGHMEGKQGDQGWTEICRALQCFIAVYSNSLHDCYTSVQLRPAPNTLPIATQVQRNAAMPLPASSSASAWVALLSAASCVLTRCAAMLISITSRQLMTLIKTAARLVIISRQLLQGTHHTHACTVTAPTRVSAVDGYVLRATLSTMRTSTSWCALWTRWPAAHACACCTAW